MHPTTHNPQPTTDNVAQPHPNAQPTTARSASQRGEAAPNAVQPLTTAQSASQRDAVAHNAVQPLTTAQSASQRDGVAHNAAQPLATAQSAPQRGEAARNAAQPLATAQRAPQRGAAARPRQKILVCSAGFGEGHNTAARNLCAALNALAPGDVQAEFTDVLAARHPRTNQVFRKGYVTLMNRAPRLWAAVYRMFDSTSLVETNLLVFATLRRALTALLERERPVAVVSTYPLYGYLLDDIAKRGGPSTFLRVMVVTDSISINTVWHRCTSDFFSVPNEDTAAVLRQQGVPAEQVRVLGFPVDARFAQPGALPARPDVAGPDGRRVLYMINAGKKSAPEVVQRLLALKDIALTIAVGRDQEMRATVDRLIGGFDQTRQPVQVIGWTNEIPELLSSHHLVISKAGGATTQESIAAKCPMIVSQIAPGQEEGNAQLLVDNRAGCLGLTPDAIADAVRDAFADDGKLWREWSANLGRLSRPDAARDNARFILEQLGRKVSDTAAKAPANA